MSLPHPTPHVRRAYLSGPMTGLPDYNVPAFNAAAKRWRALGWDVFNPAESFDGRTDLPRHVYMRIDFEALLDVDAIVFLPGWEQSAGALAEAHMALHLGLHQYHASGAKALTMLAVSGYDAGHPH